MGKMGHLGRSKYISINLFFYFIFKNSVPSVSFSIQPNDSKVLGWEKGWEKWDTWDSVKINNKKCNS